MKTITEKTLIPISLVITLAGVIWWASSLSSKVEAHEKRFEILERMEARIDKIAEDVSALRRGSP